jgi:hypothetical protein
LNITYIISPPPLPPRIFGVKNDPEPLWVKGHLVRGGGINQYIQHVYLIKQEEINQYLKNSEQLKNIGLMGFVIFCSYQSVLLTIQCID